MNVEESLATGSGLAATSRSKPILTGLAGRGILASRSPWLHEQEAQAQGLDLSYTLFDFDARGWNDAYLPALLRDLRAQGYAGINVTFPFKQAIIPHLDDLSDEARRIGAVNTVILHGGSAIGHNTDSIGFAESFRRGLSNVARDVVVQIGTGGAGAATAHALLAEGVGALHLHDRDDARAQALRDSLCAAYGPNRVVVAGDLAIAMHAADGVVNATPMGMAKFPGSPLPSALLRSEMWVADIVYFPLETELLREAAAHGCRTMNGSGMAVFQAASAFDRFTGMHADRDRMLAAFQDIPRS